MVDYIAIGLNNQPRERGQIIFLAAVVMVLLTFVAAAVVVFLIVLNLQYYETSRSLLKILHNNLMMESKTAEDLEQFRLVCYYHYPEKKQQFDDLQLVHINENLCTHINIGMVDIKNCSIDLSESLKSILKEQVPAMKKNNPNLKLLLWVGGGDGEYKESFAEMTKKHDNRKIFIKSLKETLRTYKLDGVDLDWEFPTAYNKDRQHLSQLLYEIKQEYKREKKDYLLTLAVSAARGIDFYAYDIRELNLYADFVNLMTYDYHFYTKATPFTGLNAPLYARHNEESILSTLNINYSVNWWLDNGIERNKLVVGLPTYGHTFKLVNPLNTKISAPAEGFGDVGALGFATYTQICYFNNSNMINTQVFDSETCSPYLVSVLEWISFENEESITCKTQFIKSLNLGGVMVFSLNSDDTKGFCSIRSQIPDINLSKFDNRLFPLTNTIKRIINE